jgi:hypothetical protein
MPPFAVPVQQPGGDDREIARLHFNTGHFIRLSGRRTIT